MGVKLRGKKLKNKSTALFLDIIHNKKRYKEYLGMHIIPGETKQNKEVKELAESIRAKKELEIISRGYDFVPSFKKTIDFVDYFTIFLNEYPNRDKRIVKYSLEWFKQYLEHEGIKHITPGEIKPEHCTNYIKYMETTLHGETPYNYYKKFKKVIRKAIKDRLIFENPSDGIGVEVEREALKKDILSLTEIEILAKSYCGNAEVKRAFLFCLNTGLRWVDVRVIKYKHIDYSFKTLKTVQEKTNRTVTINLNITALKLIGEYKDNDNPIFNLPSHTGALKSLRDWTKKAGINKHITWHCARHSFAVNLLGEVKADIKTVASLLGHTGIAHTEKYTRAISEWKEKAVNSLPEIKYN